MLGGLEPALCPVPCPMLGAGKIMAQDLVPLPGTLQPHEVLSLQL